MSSLKQTPGVVAPAVAIASAVMVVGMAYGSAASAAGFPPWLVIFAALLVFGASSELLFVGVIAAGGLPWLGAAAALLVNLRNFVYGFSASSFLPRSSLGRYFSVHLVNDESVAYALSQPDRGRRFAAFRVVGVAMLIAWPLGAALGVLVGYIVPDPGRLGLDAAFPAIFLVILLGIRKHSTIKPAMLGATIALATAPFAAAGVAPILGLAGLLAHTRRSQRRG